MGLSVNKCEDNMAFRADKKNRRWDQFVLEFWDLKWKSLFLNISIAKGKNNINCEVYHKFVIKTLLTSI